MESVKLFFARGAKRVLRVPTPVNLLLVASLMVWALITFYLVKLPEAFVGAYDLGQLILQLCIAYFASYIFYFLVVHLPREQEREILGPYIRQSSMVATTGGRVITREALRSGQFDPDDEFSEENLRASLAGIQLRHQAPDAYRHLGDWFRFCEYWRLHTEREIAFLLSIGDRLSAEHLSLIRDLQQSGWFIVYRMASRSQNLDSVVGVLAGHRQDCIALKEFVESEFPDPAMQSA